MGLFSTLLLLPLALSGGQDGAGWNATWAKLGQLKSLTREAEGAQGLLQALRLDEEQAAEGLRRSILSAHLQRWEGLDALLQPENSTPLGLSGEESWLLAEVLPASSHRAQAVLGALAQSEVLNSHQLDLAWRTAAAEADALRLESSALPIQEELHARYAAGWTANHLCLTLMRIGDMAQLGRVMQQAIDQEQAAGGSVAELQSQWGLALLGAGNELRARNLLGRALSRGSSNAALILGRLDLQQGRLAAARSNFRPSLLTRDPSAWALRGWAATLLPEAHTNPAGTQPSANLD